MPFAVASCFPEGMRDVRTALSLGEGKSLWNRLAERGFLSSVRLVPIAVMCHLRNRHVLDLNALIAGSVRACALDAVDLGHKA